jgi:hypothetical protein
MTKRRALLGTAVATAGLLVLVAVFALRYREPPLDGPAEPDPSIGKPVEQASVFFVGHSLIGSDMPQMIATFAQARGKRYEAHGQLGWGTSLLEHWRWDGVMDGDAPGGFKTDNRQPFYAGDAKTQLASGRYDVLILIEANGNVGGRLRKTVDSAAELVSLARAKNPHLRAYVYAGWPDRSTTPSLAAWRQQVSAAVRWCEDVARGINSAVAGPDVGVIPGGAILAEITEAAEAGQLPGVARAEQLFLDTVHPSHLGFYAIALAHYATIFRDDPTGLPAATRTEAGKPAQPTPGDAAAARMQAIVWEFLRKYPRAAIVR